MRSPLEPPGYHYPILRRPISIEQFYDELDQLLYRAGINPQLTKVTFLKSLDREHWRNPRRYAQVLIDDMHFEFSRAVLWLPQPQRIGVLSHEIGHVLAPGAGEAGADLAAQRFLGIPIRYDLRWPGKGLQTAKL